jgi:hypothetical protein
MTTPAPTASTAAAELSADMREGLQITLRHLRDELARRAAHSGEASARDAAEAMARRVGTEVTVTLLEAVLDKGWDYAAYRAHSLAFAGMRNTDPFERAYIEVAATAARDFIRNHAHVMPADAIQRFTLG